MPRKNDYRVYTDGFSEPKDHAPKGAKFSVDEMSYAMGEAIVDGLKAEIGRLDSLEFNVLAMKGTYDDFYEGDEKARDREVHRLRNRQQVLQTYIDLMSELMNEDALRSGYVPTAAERAESRAEDEAA